MMSTPTEQASPPFQSAVAGIPSTPKRRRSHTEIVVDLLLPEPPSKKARRILKKDGQIRPTTSGEVDEPKSSNAVASNESRMTRRPGRSEYGVWVGNLPFSTTRENLTKFLIEKSDGKITQRSITRLKMPSNEKAGGGAKEGKPANKGFAYVDFDSASATASAIALSEHLLEGRKLLIKDATSFEGRPAKPSSAKDSGDEPGKKGLDGGEEELKGKRKQAADIVKNTFGRKIFVGNLHFQASEEILSNHFSKCGDVAWVKIATFQDSGKCKGYGWVMFTTPEAATQATRGFVKVPDENEVGLEDFDDKEEDEEVEEGAGRGDCSCKDDGKEAAKQKPQVKFRKWYMNRLMGQHIKIEIAEDDQTRYKKRFGRVKKQARETKHKGEDPAGAEVPRKDNLSPDIQLAYRTGAMVAGKGTKTTFD